MAQSRPRDCFVSSVPQEGAPIVLVAEAVDADSCYLSQRSLRLWSCACGAAAAVIGLLGLIACVQGRMLLGNFIGGTKAIPPAAALSLLVLGALVVLVALVRNPRLKRLPVPALLLMLLQMLMLLEHSGTIPPRLTHFLLPDAWPEGADPRVAVPAALAMLLLSLCLLLWTQWHRRQLTMTMATAAGALVLPFALGYMYGRTLLDATTFSPVAAPAATGIILISLGLSLSSLASVRALRACDVDAENQRQQATERLAEELRARGDELEAIINSCADGIMICDVHGNLTRTNAAYARMLSLTEEELRLPLTERLALLKPHDPSGRPLNDAELPLTRALAGETIINYSLLVFPGTSRERAIAATASPLKDSQGHISGAVMTATDVSDLHRAQKALQESENRYRTAGELIPYGFWTSDTTGDTKYVSKSFLELLGLSFAELKELGWERVFHPDDAASVLPDWYAAVAERRYFSNEFRVRTAEGGYHWILGRGMPLLDADGEFLGYVGVNIDIAELKQTQHERELALRELEQERRVLATILEQMPAAVMAVAQPALTVVTMNREARRMLGATAGEQRDLTDAPLKLMYPDGTLIPPEQWPLARALYRGEGTESEEYLLEANGTCRTIRGQVAPILDESGEVTGAVLTFYDISREKALEAEREALAADAHRQANEFQTIINSIADGVSVTDPMGMLVRTNAAARRMLRYGDHEGVPWDQRARRCKYLRADGTEYTHEDLPLSRSLRGETVAGEVIQMEWPDGTSTWVTSSSAPLRDPQGNLLGAVLTNSDMTALRETQQETQRLLAQVQAEREWMFRLLDTLPTYVCLIRPNHEIAYTNGHFAELFGSPSAGEKCYERIVDCDRACDECRAFEPLSSGEPVNYEWRHPSRDLVLDVTNYAFTDLDGSLVSLEVGVDVTARVKAEHEVQRHRDHLEDLISERTARLAESERQHRELVESANAVILRFGADGRLTLANRYAHELFGYAPGELLGKPATIILPESDSSGENLKFIKDALLADPEAWQYNENENVTRDGRLLWISWSNHVSLNEAGEPQGVLGVGIDRTEQHEGEKQLREYQKRLRALASEVVNAEQRERQRVATLLHDEVAQTLGALKLHLSLLPGKWPEAADDVFPLIEMADDAVQQTRIIMTQLSPPILQRFGIIDALRWWAQTVEEREGLRVRVEAPDAPVRVDTVRRTAIFQAVKELLRNVIKHSGASEATVTVQADETTLHVEVSDNGNGFDPNATKTTTTEGFGLFGIRERMVHLGGSMTVSSGPGLGSRIVLRLPRNS